ncbi:radical SAM protein [Bacilliculturomica massiliensis]|uniref:radical SAM protein n=1 Tax=Bacilliculturomica massiliensis TaxID=1917867 RepID=UPI00102FD61D|nr:radical SAM protein [Bacilliculturomica massiliensis]
MSREEMVFEIGPIRPPSEAGSLLLRVTQGCTWNKCKFCDVYRSTPFRAYSAQEVKRSVDMIAAYRQRILELGARTAEGRDTVGKGTAGRNAADKDAAGSDAAGEDAAGSGTADKDAAGRGTACKDTAGKGMAGKDTADGEASGEGTPLPVPDHRAAMADMRTLGPEEQNCYFMVYNWLRSGGDTVFLQDGNTVVLSSGRLADVLRYLKEKIPGIRRITSYGRAESLARVPAEQLKELAEAGLDRIHSGFESGSDAVLALINKGATAEQEITAGRKIREAGIELSVYFMPGVGGRALSAENARETARVVSAIDPDFVRLRTSVIKPGTGLWTDVEEGRLIPCTDREKVLEIRELIERVSGCTGVLKSDHIINLLPAVEGSLESGREHMLAVIDSFLGLPEGEQRRFQLARRANLVETMEDMMFLDREMDQKIDQVCRRVRDPESWEELMNGYLRHYI